MFPKTPPLLTLSPDSEKARRDAVALGREPGPNLENATLKWNWDKVDLEFHFLFSPFFKHISPSSQEVPWKFRSPWGLWISMFRLGLN